MPDADRLTIALVTIEYPPDPYSSGLSTYTRTLAEALAKRGHRVHVVSRGRTGAPATSDQAGVTVHRVFPARPFLPPLLSRPATIALALRGLPVEWLYRRNVAAALDRLVRDHGVQLIEAVDMAAEAAFYDPARHPSVPLVVRLHTPTAVGEYYDGNLPEGARRFVGWMERRHILHATHLSGVSHRSAAIVLGHMGIVDRPVEVLPNPPSFDPNAFEPTWDDDGNTVLFVGRVNRWKGAHLLMQAVPDILRRRPRTRFLVAGEVAFTVAGHADMHAYLLSLVPTPCRHAITFLGRVPHERLAPRYRQAAVCAFPSLFEAVGDTGIEARACGKAIVASAHGGMAELLDDGACGLLFTPPDTHRLAEQVLTLLEDVDLRRRLGRLARDRVATVYARDAVLRQFEGFYRTAIAESVGVSG